MDDDPKKKAKREAKTEKENIRPEFLTTTDELKAAEKAAAGKSEEGGGFYRPESSLDETKANEESGGKKLFSGSGKVLPDKKGSKLNIGKLSPAIIIIFLIIILIVIVVAVASPLLMIGQIDYNLQKALGFTDTVAILEEQAEYVTAEMLAEGEVPNGYANDLADNGITVGQVTAKGDFIPTNVYIADIESLGEVAAIGNYQVNIEDGELAVLYNDKVIKASEFVATVESDPVMYADYSEAVDISARYYYSSEVDKVYKDMGLSRSTFINWESTGDNEKDTESYYEILNKMLDDGESALTVNGVDEETELDEEGEPIKGSHFQYSVSSSVINKLAKDDENGVRRKDVSDATNRAGQLLNSAISSGEPYRAAKAFMAIEEPIQRARIGDNGPVNQVMNSLYEKTKVSYVDVNTRQLVTQEKSILETSNFVAAVSEGNFSKEEANNFSRDRIAMVTGTGNTDAIKNTIVSSSDSSSADTLTGLKSHVRPNLETLNAASNSIDIATGISNSEVFLSVIGGNRAVAGGSFLSNKINQKVLGAAPSDATTIAAYHKEVEKVLARQAEAERATLSPFDISSPNTFLGSIVSTFANAMIANATFSPNNDSIAPMFTAMAGVASSSINDLTSGVMAEGEDTSYTTLSGDICTTVNSLGVEGDIYCTSHNTITTKYMYRTRAEWGNIENEREFKEYVENGVEREPTVGVMSAEVCDNLKGESFIARLINSLASLFGVYRKCLAVDKNAATGLKYTLSSENSSWYGNVEKYSGYILYNTVYSLLSEKQTAVSRIREEYYAEHPRDNSAAGRVARISGMSKEEAEIALNYASYLDFIARYDASDRFAFGDIKIERKKSFFVEQDEKIKENLYGIWSKRSEYRDERNRNYTV